MLPTLPLFFSSFLKGKNFVKNFKAKGGVTQWPLYSKLREAKGHFHDVPRLSHQKSRRQINKDLEKETELKQSRILLVKLSIKCKSEIKIFWVIQGLKVYNTKTHFEKTLRGIVLQKEKINSTRVLYTGRKWVNMLTNFIF